MIDSKKTSRQRKTKDPCLGCYLHKNLCMCSLIPSLELRTRLCLVIHHRELKRTTNTGRLATKILKNSIMKIRGLQDEPLNSLDVLSEDYETLLLFPSKDAEILDKDLVKSIDKKIQIIVPDGNWRQASKVNTRYPELKNVRRVMVQRKEEDSGHLRAESTEDGMATLQAIGHAFKILESENIGNQILEIYHEKLNRTLKSRGN